MRRLVVASLVVVWSACGSSPPPEPPLVFVADPPAGSAAAPHAVAPPADAGPRPPVAARRHHDVVAPAGTRDDEYYWLRDDARKDPDVLAYLAAEQKYTEAMLAPQKSLEDTIFEELKSRVAEDDSSVPTLDNGYWYYNRVEAGKQLAIRCRKKGALTAPEEILLDGNQLGVGHDFYAIGAQTVSRDNKLLAWVDDSVGRNQFVLHVKNLATGQLLPDTLTNVSPSLAWANDNKTLFVVGKDPTTLRTDRVFRVELGKPAAEAFREPDGSYYVGVDTTKSHRYVVIEESAETNDHFLLVDADHPAAAPKEFLPRTTDTLMQIEHLGRTWTIRTNDGGANKNFRVVTVADGRQADKKAWKEIIPHRDDTLVEGVAVYDRFDAASIRSGGLRKVMVLPAGKPSYVVDAPDPTYAMTVVDTPDAAANKVRYSYDSLVRPNSIFEVDVATRAATLLKQQPVPGFDPKQYASEYVHATASDGTLVPVSLVYKATTKRDGRAPLLVYGYGSYGFSMEPWFTSSIVSLLDRGWVYAVVHVRGGQEMGRAWYDDGHLMHKTNTFTDFIAGTEFLVAHGYGAKDQVFAEGGSAGGLLVGAILNMRPDLYRGVAAIVPFVDVVTTMLDDSIPLTTNEFTEWGNPKEPDAYKYMLSYSPYDNVTAQAYPSIFVHTGLWDSQVQYFEPTKWVAKLRATKTDANPVILDIDMTSGHGGASGRYDKLRQTARMLAFFVATRERPDRRAK